VAKIQQKIKLFPFVLHQAIKRMIALPSLHPSTPNSSNYLDDMSQKGQITENLTQSLIDTLDLKKAKALHLCSPKRSLEISFKAFGVQENLYSLLQQNHVAT